MDYGERVDAIRNRVMERIGSAAKEADSPTLLFLSRILEEADVLIERAKGLQTAVEALERRLNSIPGRVKPPEEELVSPSDKLGLSRKKDVNQKPQGRNRAHSKAVREGELQKLNKLGVDLTRETEALYRTQNGKLIGVPSAIEARPDRWFLGLPSLDYQGILMICERSNGEVATFYLPGKFFQQYANDFSRSGDNLKFNVVRQGGNYSILVPGHGNVDITKYMNNPSLFHIG